MNSVTPAGNLVRSLLYREHQQRGARFESVAGAVLVARYVEPDEETAQARRLALADLSTLPRCGFKGADTTNWFAGKLTLPEAPNRLRRQADGSLVLRLSRDELLCLSDAGLGGRLPACVARPAATGRVYPVPRRDSHCWFALTGTRGPAVLAKVCGIDLRTHKFPTGEVAQTSLARVEAIVARSDLGATPCWHILSDASSAEYLWHCLLDAMAEFAGQPAGAEALRQLTDSN